MSRLANIRRAVLIVVTLPAWAGAQVVEVEPNNTLPDADARPHFAGNVVISGAISPVGDLDLFRIDLAAATVVRFQSFQFDGTDCAPNVNIVVRLHDDSGGVMYEDGGGVLGECGALTVALPVGSYYVSVAESGNDATILGYKLAIDTFVSGGSESEPNDSATTANPFAGIHAYVMGEVEGPFDPDYFSFTVPPGGSVRAEMIEGPEGTVSCPFFDGTARLVLRDGSGSLVMEDNLSGRWACPLIDGVRRHPAARNLSGGTYTLSVWTGVYRFAYRVVIEIVPPDLIFADDFDMGPPARVVINEINATISTQTCDLIELRVVAGGNMNGYSLRERDNQTLVVFSNLTVATHDLVVVHVNGASSTCNPGGAGDETASKTQRPAGTYPANYDTAWDWYSSDENLNAADNVLTLYDEEGRVMDAVLAYRNNFDNTVTTLSENQAAVVAAAGEWQMVGGGVPVGGFVGANFRVHAVLELAATGTTKTGTSIQRTTDLDSNDKNGWTTGTGAPSTWGSLNSGQTP